MRSTGTSAQMVVEALTTPAVADKPATCGKTAENGQVRLCLSPSIRRPLAVFARPLTAFARCSAPPFAVHSPYLRFTAFARCSALRPSSSGRRRRGPSTRPGAEVRPQLKADFLSEIAAFLL